MREQILAIIEKNSRISVKELAVILGAEEIDVANELKALEEGSWTRSWTCRIGS